MRSVIRSVARILSTPAGASSGKALPAAGGQPRAEGERKMFWAKAKKLAQSSKVSGIVLAGRSFDPVQVGNSTKRRFRCMSALRTSLTLHIHNHHAFSQILADKAARVTQKVSTWHAQLWLMGVCGCI